MIPKALWIWADSPIYDFMLLVSLPVMWSNKWWYLTPQHPVLGCYPLVIKNSFWLFTLPDVNAVMLENLHEWCTSTPSHICHDWCTVHHIPSCCHHQCTILHWLAGHSWKASCWPLNWNYSWTILPVSFKLMFRLQMSLILALFIGCRSSHFWRLSS